MSHLESFSFHTSHFNSFNFFCILSYPLSISYPQYKPYWNNDFVFDLMSLVNYYYNLEFLFNSQENGFQMTDKISFQILLSATIFICLFYWIFLILTAYSLYLVKKQYHFYRFLKTLINILYFIFCLNMFQPFLNILLSQLKCSHTDSIQIFEIKMECYNTFHLGFIVFFSVSLIILIGVNILYSAFKFEPQKNRGLPMNSFNSNWFLVLQLFKFTASVFRQFDVLVNSALTHLLFMTIISFILFIITRKLDVFYNKLISKIWSTVILLNFWTYLCLMPNALGKRENFNFVFYWIVGSVLLILYNSCALIAKEEAFHIHLDQIENVNDYIHHIEILVNVIKNQSTEYNKIVLRGYIQDHKKDCEDSLCPLRSSRIRRLKEGDQINSYEMYTTQKYGQMPNYVNHIYKNGIIKFPNSIQIKLKYSYYLFEEFNSTPLALEQLKQFENDPQMWMTENYIVERLKEMMKIKDLKDPSNLSSLNNFDEVEWIGKMNLLVEKLAYLFLDFWTNVNCAQVDFHRIFDIGSLIKHHDKELESLFKDVDISQINSQSLHLYAYCLSDIFNDKESSDYMFNIIRKKMISKSRYEKYERLILSDQNLGEIGTPLVIISGMKKDFCKIVNLNSAASSLFGYTKNQLMSKFEANILDRKVDTLMPKILAEYHDSFVSNYLKTMKGNLIDNERFLLAQHKTGYLFPVNIFVKVIENSAKQSLHFISYFKQDKKFKRESFMFVTERGDILGISSNSKQNISIGLKDIESEKYLDTYFPGLLLKTIQIQDPREKIVTEQSSRKTKKSDYFQSFNGSPRWQSHALLLSSKNISTNKIDKDPKKSYYVSVTKLKFRRIQGFLMILKFTLTEEDGQTVNYIKQLNQQTFYKDTLNPENSQDQSLNNGQGGFKISKNLMDSIYKLNRNTFMFEIHATDSRFTASMFKKKDTLKYEVNNIINLQMEDFEDENNNDEYVVNNFLKKKKSLVQGENVRLLKLRDDHFIKEEPRNLLSSDEEILDNKKLNKMIRKKTLKIIQKNKNHSNPKFKKIMYDDQPFKSIFSSNRKRCFGILKKVNNYKFLYSSRAIYLIIICFSLSILILLVMQISNMMSAMELIENYARTAIFKNRIFMTNNLIQTLLLDDKFDSSTRSIMIDRLNNHTTELLYQKELLSGTDKYIELISHEVNIQYKDSKSSNFLFGELLGQFLTKTVNLNIKLNQTQKLDRDGEEEWFVLQNGNNLILIKFGDLLDDLITTFESSLNILSWIFILLLLFQFLLLGLFIFAEIILFSSYKHELYQLLSVFLKIESGVLKKYDLKAENFLMKMITYREEINEEIIKKETNLTSGLVNRFGFPIKRFKNRPEIMNREIFCVNLLPFYACLCFIIIVINYYQGREILLKMSPGINLSSERSSRFSAQLLGQLSFFIDSNRTIYDQEPKVFLRSNIEKLLYSEDKFLNYMNQIDDYLDDKSMYMDLNFKNTCFLLKFQELRNCISYSSFSGRNGLKSQILYSSDQIEKQRQTETLDHNTLQIVLMEDMALNQAKEYITISIKDMIVSEAKQVLYNKILYLSIVCVLWILNIINFIVYTINNFNNQRNMAKYVASLVPKSLVLDNESILSHISNYVGNSKIKESQEREMQLIQLNLLIKQFKLGRSLRRIGRLPDYFKPLI